MNRRVVVQCVAISLLVCTIFNTALAQDSDGDGVSDTQERIDQTDPEDADHYLEHSGATSCADWNGYLSSFAQIFEIRNTGCGDAAVRVDFRGIDGSLLDQVSAAVGPSAQVDVVLNGLNGFAAQTYGTVCATVTSGPPDAIETGTVYYTLRGDSFSQVVAAHGVRARSGSQFVTFNTYSPSPLPEYAGKLTADYVQVVNESDATQNGALHYFDQDGRSIRRAPVELPPHGRFDVSTHSVGANRVGLVEWRPADSAATFRLLSTRYYYDGPTNRSTLLGAVALPFQRPTGYRSAAAFETQSNLIAVLELGNTLDVEVRIPVTVYDASGEAVDDQPGTVAIAPSGVYHVILNEYLPEGLGSVVFDPNRNQAVTAVLLEYSLSDIGSFRGVTATKPTSGFGSTQLVSYNNFLGPCRLRLANLTNSPQEVALSMSRYDGTTLPLESPITLSAHETQELPVCENEDALGYGPISVRPTSSEIVVGTMVRSNRAETSSFHVPLQGRAACAGTLAATPNIVSLTAGGDASAALLVTNKSNSVTLTNVQALLPSTWTEVTQDATACQSLAPGERCSLTFTPGNVVRAPETISIQADNALPVSVIVAVIAPSS
ncbi:MAG: hypothetical protein KDD69_08045 [Bdellovibrionales bacterium]|nr:hypothetical protein [Bdellovibrionales bacterium]